MKSRIKYRETTAQGKRINDVSAEGMMRLGWKVLGVIPQLRDWDTNAWGMLKLKEGEKLNAGEEWEIVSVVLEEAFIVVPRLQKPGNDSPSIRGVWEYQTMEARVTVGFPTLLDACSREERLFSSMDMGLGWAQHRLIEQTKDYIAQVDGA